MLTDEDRFLLMKRNLMVIVLLLGGCADIEQLGLFSRYIAQASA